MGGPLPTVRPWTQDAGGGARRRMGNVAVGGGGDRRLLAAVTEVELFGCLVV
jgi:hypothetical protein